MTGFIKADHCADGRAPSQREVIGSIPIGVTSLHTRGGVEMTSIDTDGGPRYRRLPQRIGCTMVDTSVISEIKEFSPFIAPAITAIVGAAIAATATHYWTRQRMGPEKVWADRMKLYSEIIEAISAASVCFLQAQVRIEITSQERLLGDTAQDAVDKGWEALNKAFDAVNQNPLVCSENVKTQVHKLQVFAITNEYAEHSEALFGRIRTELRSSSTKLEQACRVELGTHK